jgi:succinate dehydrogenase/fumarate reductase flavoprotein subunit
MSRIKKKITTEKVSDVRKELQSIGDKTAGVFHNTSDLKAAQIALKAYNGAISAAKAQLIYKKLTGSPGSIDFFEES